MAPQRHLKEQRTKEVHAYSCTRGCSSDSSDDDEEQFDDISLRMIKISKSQDVRDEVAAKI